MFISTVGHDWTTTTAGPAVVGVISGALAAGGFFLRRRMAVSPFAVVGMLVLLGVMFIAVVVAMWALVPPRAMGVMMGGLWAATLATSHVRRRRVAQRRQAASGLCPGCGYDLRMSEYRCPECGQPVPEDLARRRRLYRAAEVECG